VSKKKNTEAQKLARIIQNKTGMTHEKALAEANRQISERKRMG